MHGQKKRRKRSIDGLIVVDGICLSWHVLTEPQWTTEDGYRGLRISVQTEGTRHRELIVEFPFPNKTTGVGIPQLPQHPKFTERTVEDGIRRAITAGWEPQSRGKTFVHNFSEFPTTAVDTTLPIRRRAM
jgi:hypothetical protein